MPFAALDRIVIANRPANVAGATVFDELDTWLDVEWTEARDLSDQVTLRVPYSARAKAALAKRRVINLIEAPATPGATSALRAFRIHGTTVRRSREGLVLTAEGRSMWHDFTDAGAITVALSGGTKEFSVAGTLTWTDWMSTYGIPHLHAQGYTWYSATGGPGNTFPLAFERWTVAQMAEAIRTTLGDVWRLYLDPTTWALSLQQVAPFPATGALVIVEDGHNLLSLEDAENAQEQATILDAIGGKGHSNNSRGVQHFAFGAANINALAKTFQPVTIDESGWAYPILQFDGQFVDPSGARSWYVQRIDTGRSHKIVATSGAGTAAPVFTLADWPAKPGLPFVWLWELREGLTPATPIDVAVPGRPLRVNGAPAGAVLTLDDPINNGDPVPTDDVHLDHRVRVSALRLATTCSNVTTVAGSTTEQDITLASTAGIVVGDWGFLHNNVGVPWTLFGQVFTVVQLISGTVVRVRARYTWFAGLPLTAGATAKQARFYFERSASRTFAIDEVAATNQVTVSDPTAIANQDLVEYYLENSGARLTGIPAPSLLTDGVVRKEQTFDGVRCVRNLLGGQAGLGIVGNPHFNDWPVGPTAPTGWTRTALVVNKVTTNLPGPGTIHAVQLVANGAIRSAPVFVRPTAGDSKVSVRVQVRVGSAFGNWDGTQFDQFTVSVFAAGGSVALGSLTLVPDNTAAPPAGAQVVKANTIVTADLLAVDVLHTPGVGQPYAPVVGLEVQLSVSGSGGTCNATVGGVLLVEDSLLPETSYLPANGDQSLWGVGSIVLGDIHEGTRNVRADMVDLGRLLAEQYPAHAIEQDTLVRLLNEELGLSVERRIAVVRRRANPAGAVTVDVETQQRRFTDLLTQLWTRT